MDVINLDHYWLIESATINNIIFTTITADAGAVPSLTYALQSDDSWGPVFCAHRAAPIFCCGVHASRLLHCNLPA